MHTTVFRDVFRVESTRCTNFPKMQGPPQNCRHQSFDMKLAPYSRHTNRHHSKRIEVPRRLRARRCDPCCRLLVVCRCLDRVLPLPSSLHERRSKEIRLKIFSTLLSHWMMSLSQDSVFHIHRL